MTHKTSKVCKWNFYEAPIEYEFIEYELCDQCYTFKGKNNNLAL